MPEIEVVSPKQFASLTEGKMVHDLQWVDSGKPSGDGYWRLIFTDETELHFHYKSYDLPGIVTPTLLFNAIAYHSQPTQFPETLPSNPANGN